jgi:uncharacterized repeat protein (TIGR03803 family)
MTATQLAQAQTFSVLHNFTGGADGAQPYVGLTMDPAGNLYGTAIFGGVPGGCYGSGCGTVFKLSRTGSNWIFSPLYSFTGSTDGSLPAGRVVRGPNGTLYGTTLQGGADNTGVVFNLHPPAHISGRVFSPWIETVLYQFGGVSDGNYPVGDLLFDAAGNIYGTTQNGGYECEDTVYCGTVYELTPHGSSWTESILYEFTSGSVAIPLAGVISDQAGNLYGTTWDGNGAVFELIHSGSGWTENNLYQFGALGDGHSPAAGVIFDPAGHLYGTTQYGGAHGVGTVFELTHSGAVWTESILYSLSGNGTPGSLVRDASGNLYGTSCGGGTHDSGTVFKLTPSGGGWAETDLHDFTGGSDGYCPVGNVILDAQGNIYGATGSGGSQGLGVVFEITPAMHYTTNFPLTENPISENGKWTNGQATGLDWSNCQTTTNFAFGTQDGSGGYDDSTCVVNGSWGPVQTATGTVHVTTQSAFQEVELRLHTTLTPHSITGYEINLSVGSNRYAQVVRWNGPLNDFTLLDGRTTGTINDGDVLKATIDRSGVITVYINNVQQFQVTDTTFAAGNPGMGFYSAGGTNSNFGFSSFTATGE